MDKPVTALDAFLGLLIVGLVGLASGLAVGVILGIRVTAAVLR
jgi:F0F1-type ATP synthase membrane subunit c/vacuolar-type H+-ATPase subunit K